MKINQNQSQSHLTGVDGTRHQNMEQLKSKLKDVSDKASAMGSSSVQLSPEAKMFNKAKSIASDSNIDEAKVAHLQKLIDEDKYKIDAKALADQLVDEHLVSEE